jgi:hypothetical protein
VGTFWIRNPEEHFVEGCCRRILIRLGGNVVLLFSVIPQITSPSMTRQKPPSFSRLYIYIYIGPDLHALCAQPTSSALFCVFRVHEPRILFLRILSAPPFRSFGKVRARGRTLPHHEDKVKPYSVRAETRIGISGPAYGGARTKRKTSPTLSLSLALALPGMPP